MALGHGRTGTNNFSGYIFIVDKDGVDKGATHTTIQGAYDDASGWDTIIVKPASTPYAENLTPVTNTTLIGCGEGTANGGSPVIDGNINANSLGACTFQGLRFEPTADVILSDSGTTGGSIIFDSCFFYADGTNEVFSVSNANRTIITYTCECTVPSGSKALTNAGGNIVHRFCNFNAASSTTSTSSAGSVAFQHCTGCYPITTSGTSGMAVINSNFNTAASNTKAITAGGSGSHIFQGVTLRTGSATAMTVTSGVTANDIHVNSTNASLIDGAGTLAYDEIGSIQGAGTVDTSTQTSSGIFTGQLRLATALDETYGGTGQTTFTTGDILYASGSNTLSKLAVGSNGEVLTLAAGVPSWAAASGGGDKEYYFKASDFDALETNFAPLTQDNGSTSRVIARAFDDTTEEFVNFSIKAPGNIDTSGTVTFRVWMYAATAVAARFVQLTFDHRAVDNSESWDGAYTSEDSGDIAIDATQDDITEATWTETVTNLGWAADDFIMCRLSRIAPSGTNLSGDLYVLGFAVEIPRS